MAIINFQNYPYAFYENAQFQAGISVVYGTPEDEGDMFNVYIKVKDTHEELENKEFYNLKAALDYANQKFRNWTFGDRVQLYRQEKLNGEHGACSSCDNKH